MLISVGVLFGAIFAFKLFQTIMIKRFLAANASPIVTVSTMKVPYEKWDTTLTAVGSLRAIQGVNVTTELAGMIKYIFFNSGAYVKKGEILVQLNADSDIAQLNALKANEDLAKITYKRDKAQFAIHAVSEQVVDSDRQNLKNLEAQVAQQSSTTAKKTIVAPFDGRLGIRAVNLGQYINPGDKIVSLQTLDPIYIDFYLPQQKISKIKINMPVTVTSDSFPGKKYKGVITTIEPQVDVNTRNVAVEATLNNSKFELTPGMFASVNVYIAQPKRFLTVPQTAITYNPYGNIVYVVDHTGKDKNGKTFLSVMQSFVTTGDTRGDQIKILKGLKEGQEIVTSGQLKLKNGSHIAVNNAIMPSNNPNPSASNEHEGSKA